MQKHQIIYRKLNKNAMKLADLDFLYQEVASRMINRLDYIKLEPKSVLDIGSGLNIDALLLKKRYPQANLYKIDSAFEVIKHYNKPKPWQIFSKSKDLICADAINLPFLPLSMDLVWSNLALPYIDQIKEFFSQIYKVLNVGGTFLITGLGVDTFGELRDAGLTTYNFPDMHLIGDILVGLGFSNPVTDVEYINLEYDSLSKLLSDIRTIGVGAAASHITKISKKDYLSLESRFTKKNGKYNLTLELFYAHAWKDDSAKHQALQEQIIQFYPRGAGKG